MACVSPRLREIRARAPDIIAPIADDPNAAEVVKISELDPRHSVERELLLATVRVTPEHRGQVVELATIFDAKILAVGVEARVVDA